VTTRRVQPAEAGFTLIETLVVLAILGIVLAGLTQLFVAGLNTETDQNARAQAQLDARLALDRLRREVHCGSAVSPNPNGTWPTQAITIVLPSYCQTNTTGAASVTWCTSGSGPYTLWRYPHATDLSGASYATACAGSGSSWATDIVNAGPVTGGQIFSNLVAPTLPALGSPDLAYGKCATGPCTLGNAASSVTYGYVVDPIVSGVEQPGTEEIITFQAGVTGKSILVDWSTACAAYPQNASITGFRVYGRTPGGEQFYFPVTSSGCATTSWEDTGSGVGTSSGSPLGATRSKFTVTLPVSAKGNQGPITIQDDITLRNTPR
jgi:prepilin-type N-terminal cleavage/methylation domain-containing protein